jgi:hypothetical protein
MISLCRNRHQSGSRVLDPRTTTWILTGLIACPRLNPTNEFTNDWSTKMIARVLQFRDATDRRADLPFASVLKYNVGVVPKVFLNMEIKALGVL